VKRRDIVLEVQSMLEVGGYQVAKRIVDLADKPEGTFHRIGKRGHKRDMSQAEAKRMVDTAKARIALVDAAD
jgi:hypothetical protein